MSLKLLLNSEHGAKCIDFIKKYSFICKQLLGYLVNVHWLLQK